VAQSATSEKRQSDRVPAQHMVSFAYTAEGMKLEPTSGLGRTLDVSGGGALVETSRPLEIGQHLALDIAMGSQIVRVEATVVHITPTDPQMIAAGVAFDEIPPSDRETMVALGFDILSDA